MEEIRRTRTQGKVTGIQTFIQKLSSFLYNFPFYRNKEEKLWWSEASRRVGYLRAWLTGWLISASVDVQPTSGRDELNSRRQAVIGFIERRWRGRKIPHLNVIALHELLLVSSLVASPRTLKGAEYFARRRGSPLHVRGIIGTSRNSFITRISAL